MKRLPLALLLLCLLVILFALMAGLQAGSAAPLAQVTPTLSNLSIADETCLGCHGQPGQTLTLEDGSTLDLYVDPQAHATSIHGLTGIACAQCHTDVGEYPHPPFTATNRRDVTLQLNAVCQRCHASQKEKTLNSVHNQAQQEGNTAAAVCSDCHTAHAVQDWVDNATLETLPEARTVIPQTCAQCHNAIYQEYLTSVHGKALTEENNPDVPTCIDCHGSHEIQDPNSNEFRLASPQMCADCHADPARMAKYGVSTDVLTTYVADFHGTTVTIFEKQSPDAETNKPVCYDCHGVHNIKRADDPEKGLQVQENLLATCQKCHPDAQENFPTAWLSHYIPSPDKYPVVYYVDLFYKIFIPTVLGGMSLLVVMDFTRSAINRSRRRKSLQLEISQASPPHAGEGGAEETAVEPSGAEENASSGFVSEQPELVAEEPTPVEEAIIPEIVTEEMEAPEQTDQPSPDEEEASTHSPEGENEENPGEEVDHG